MNQFKFQNNFYFRFVFFLAFECFEIGRVAYENSDFYHTVRWMMESLRLSNLEIDTKEITVNIADILDYLSFSTAKVIVTSFEIHFN
jgi:hypothetical protein